MFLLTQLCHLLRKCLDNEIALRFSKLNHLVEGFALKLKFGDLVFEQSGKGLRAETGLEAKHGSFSEGAMVIVA